MPRSRPKRVQNAQKTHILIEKSLLDEIDKSGMSRADFIRCGIRLYLQKTHPRNLTAISLRYKLGLKKSEEGRLTIVDCRRDMEALGLTKDQIGELEGKWYDEIQGINGEKYDCQES